MFKKALTGERERERERERESGTIIFKNVVYLVFRRFVVAMELERHDWKSAYCYKITTRLRGAKNKF